MAGQPYSVCGRLPSLDGPARTGASGRSFPANGRPAPQKRGALHLPLTQAIHRRWTWAAPQGSDAPASRNPDDDLLATLSGLINLRLRLRADEDTGCVEARCSCIRLPLGDHWWNQRKGRPEDRPSSQNRCNTVTRAPPPRTSAPCDSDSRFQGLRFVGVRFNRYKSSPSWSPGTAFSNIPDQCTLVLAPEAGLELAMRPIAAVARLNGWEASA
jgi:hypothetical protein